MTPDKRSTIMTNTRAGTRTRTISKPPPNVHAKINGTKWAYKGVLKSISSYTASGS